MSKGKHSLTPFRVPSEENGCVVDMYATSTREFFSNLENARITESITYGPFSDIEQLQKFLSEETELSQDLIDALPYNDDAIPFNPDMLPKTNFKGNHRYREQKVFSVIKTSGEGYTKDFCTFSNLIDELSEIVKEAEFRFGEKVYSAVIGGWAVILNGYERTTNDMDIMVCLDGVKPLDESALDLQKCIYEVCKEKYGLTEKDIQSKKPIVDYWESFKNGIVCFIHPNLGVKIDILFAYHKHDFVGVKMAQFREGLSQPVVRPEELVEMKKLAGGPRDMVDVDKLMQKIKTKITEDCLENKIDSETPDDYNNNGEPGL